MATDVYIDPQTRDFVETDDGWLETDDASTAVLCQLDCELDRWWGDPTAGSKNAEILRGEVPTIEELQDSSTRAMRQLVAAGMISDLFVTVDEGATDESRGFGQLLFQWFDRASNRPADLAYSPLGGKPL